jgi:hypothetical protein
MARLIKNYNDTDNQKNILVKALIKRGIKHFLFITILL